MNTTIIGAGNMGRGIASRFVAGGHSVTFVDADPQVAQQAAAETLEAATNGASVEASTLNDVELGEVVVLALWYGENKKVVQQLGEKLSGKVVVDIANPLNETFDGLATAPGSSSAEEVAQAAGPDAAVIKAFNTTFAGTLHNGEVNGQPLDVFIAGNDESAKGKVKQLVEDGGMRPVDIGPLERARNIEAMGLLHIILQSELNTNWGSGVKIVG